MSFNPRPARSSGATVTYWPSTFGAEFQSTPRSIERGDLVANLALVSSATVSIHAPLDRAGRRDFCRANDYVFWFQSTPRSIERGDASRRCCRPTAVCFNPRPARSSGATDMARHHMGDGICGFNPRPARSSGATSTLITPRLTSCGFNPRPARSSGATIMPNSSVFGLARFQSTPRSIERGDRWRRATAMAVRAVSIHAPLDRAGRPISCRDTWMPKKFQSTPRSIERGDAQRPKMIAPNARFNPRPARSSGATKKDARPRSCSVSFNPRPARSSGATADPLRLDLGVVGFNPRPARSSGATPRAHGRGWSSAPTFQSTPRSIERGVD